MALYGGITIKRVGPNDLDEYVDRLVIHPNPKAQLAERLAADQPVILLVAQRVGSFIGQAIVNPDAPTRPETLAHIPYPTPALSFMHVLEEERRQGAGALLLETAAAFAATELGATNLMLTVAEDNLAAKGLYAAHGFTDWGHGTFALPHFDPNPDGSWPTEPIIKPVNVMLRPL